MQLRLVSFLFLLAFCSLALLGNKNGRASQAQRGNTGAPGDETSGGQPKTCQSCHNSGPIVASLAISVLDTGNNPVTQYKPGQQYTARVTITASGSGLMGYGFQMIALRDSGNVDLDGFTDTNPNNYKIASIPNGRTYAEHDNVSTANTFSVKWTAPPAGTGSVTFYSAGNGVNKNGGTGGDGSGRSTLQLTEFGVSSTSNLSGQLPKLTVTPNPVVSESVLNIENLAAGDYQIKAFDASGVMVWESSQRLVEKDAKMALPTTNWHPGTYFLLLESGQKVTSVKVVKL